MKTIPSASQRYGKYVVLFGIFLGVAGLVSGAVSGKPSPTSIALALSGLAVAIAGLILWGSSPNGFLRQRSAREGTNAIIATLSFIAILGLVNFLAVRYSTRADFTETGLFTLSPQSREIVANLPKPLKVIVFDPKEDFSDRQLLENYARQGANFQYEFVDPQIKVGLAQEFGLKSPKAVYLQYGDRKQQVQSFRNEEEQIAEIPLTNGIEKILRDKKPVVYFLQGHGEWSLADGTEEGSISQAVSSLSQKGYDVKALSLAQQSQVPPDADAIAIFGPKRALFEGEVTALKDYLDRGGSLLIAIDPKNNPNLEPILNEWGVKLDERLVIDASGSGSILNLGPATPLVTQYGVHPITSAFGNSISVYPLARSIETESKKEIQAFPLIETSEKSWAETNLDSENLSFDPNNDLQGPLTLGIALTKREAPATGTEGKTEESKNANPAASPSPSPGESPTPGTSPTPSPSPGESPTPGTSPTPSPSPGESPTPGTSPSPSPSPGETPKAGESPKESPAKAKDNKESRLVVLGNSTFASNGWFDQQINRDVFLNSVEWLAKNDKSTLSISPKQPKNRRLNLTLGQASVLGWLAIVIVPLLSLAIAALMWWRRR
ncbi:Gldg family protein [Oscillatoria sp. FACHB-1406]|uniref:GldG family protein n=1 Tax=Oscillatoria sp. FACHB-1406 TaxID=2692846 RepID=UPI00168487B5|nr:Gldg family protein [Oscillatoria sp. FACHB-1406]MBD2577163.1 Gldg family protein [Oscillatoria sp. FACHB-1406]